MQGETRISGSVDFAMLSAGPESITLTAEREGGRSGRIIGPGVSLEARTSEGHVLVDRAVAIACAGLPVFRDRQLQALARAEGPAAVWRTLYEKHGPTAPSAVSGGFALAVLDVAKCVLHLATDAFGIRSICCRVEGTRIEFADRADTLAGSSATLSPQALFNYLFFHFIPSPLTVFEGVVRLPPRHALRFDGRTQTIAPYATPGFDESSLTPLAELQVEFKRLLRQAVERQIDSIRVGSFLSGGTDSSTVAGLLREVTGESPRTYSIGFDAAGFDEVEYARIAARHFETRHREHYLSPQEVVSAVPTLAAAYDQPFGNSSALPAYYCAKIAREDGVERLLGGDGGDELFGGNARYGKQGVFEAYQRLPHDLRRSVLEPLLGHAAMQRLPLIGKARSYVAQANTPLPERLHSYNLLIRLGPQDILSPEFLQLVDTREPLCTERKYYASADASCWLNRVLFLDWKYTLADNDLPKVVQSCALAGVTAVFPLLDLELLDFANMLPPDLKVKGNRLRVFFKRALADFLPREIIQKKKHGFGMPFGLWLMRHRELRTLAVDSLRSLRNRGIIQGTFLDKLPTELLPQHPSYYGELVWILMMLEQWFLAKAPRFHV